MTVSLSSNPQQNPAGHLLSNADCHKHVEHVPCISSGFQQKMQSVSVSIPTLKLLNACALKNAMM